MEIVKCNVNGQKVIKYMESRSALVVHNLLLFLKSQKINLKFINFDCYVMTQHPMCVKVNFHYKFKAHSHSPHTRSKPFCRFLITNEVFFVSYRQQLELLINYVVIDGELCNLCKG